MADEQPKQDLTFGEKAVGLSFNPSNNKDVEEIKQLCAKLVDKVEEVKKRQAIPSYMENTLSGEAMRQILSAQMWAVKFVTWQE